MSATESWEKQKILEIQNAVCRDSWISESSIRKDIVQKLQESRYNIEVMTVQYNKLERIRKYTISSEDAVGYMMTLFLILVWIEWLLFFTRNKNNMNS
jgi:hypothetical protein